jgi:ribosome-binding protein aMBF1 (putative translation factor)
LSSIDTALERERVGEKEQKMTRTYRDWLNENMQNPEFAVAWETALPELEIKRLIVDARIENGWTQKELAEKCGLRQSNISRLETGGSSPTLKTIQLLAKGLGKKLILGFY